MSRREPTGLAFRIGVVTIVVALASVLIAAAVSYSLIRRAAQDEARAQLAREAELVAGLVNPDRDVAPRVRQLLVRSGIRLVLVARNGKIAGRPPLASSDLQGLRSGRAVSRVETIAGHRYYVEGRPRPGGRGVLLVQPARLTSGEARAFLDRELLACLAGLVVAVVAGALLAYRLARPLRQAASGAHRLAAGERDVRIPRGGPAEVAEVADSLNALAGALEASEGRQRDFLLSVSHELRTPLTAITGFAEALRDGVTPPEQVAATGEVMLAEARRLDRLIGDLLALARLAALDFPIYPAATDLRSVVRDAARVWAARCSASGVRCTLEEPPGPVWLSTDAARVRQIIDGLAENALRVTPAGAVIVIALRPQPWGAAVEVRDGGPGLSDDDLAVAFDRGVLYQRYRGVRQGGSGLGLALVQRLAVRLGGTAAAAHAPEGGACFAVTLPWPAAAVPGEQPLEPPSAGGPGS